MEQAYVGTTLKKKQKFEAIYFIRYNFLIFKIRNWFLILVQKTDFLNQFRRSLLQLHL